MFLIPQGNWASVLCSAVCRLNMLGRAETWVSKAWTTKAWAGEAWAVESWAAATLPAKTWGAKVWCFGSLKMNEIM